jgi:predicted flap endonuclease-1-like 5' DNA nuclease
MRLVLALSVLCAAPLALASNYAVEDIPQTIPAPDAQKLKAAGVATTFALLEKGGSMAGRKTLAKQTKIADKTLESWVQMADLLRVKGIGPDVARLLTAAGVRTVEQLKNADAAKLNDEIAKVNSKQKLSDNPPSTEHLQAWIAQAKTLPIVLK